MKGYTPIDCNLYDRLVLLSSHKSPIVMIPNKYNIAQGDYITDLVTIATKEEFMIMKSGLRIRLDEIASAEGAIVFLHTDERYFQEE